MRRTTKYAALDVHQATTTASVREQHVTFAEGTQGTAAGTSCSSRWAAIRTAALTMELRRPPRLTRVGLSCYFVA